MTRIEAKPAIAAVIGLFSTSPDGLREIVRAVVQEMLETEMTDALGAEKGERTSARRLAHQQLPIRRRRISLGVDLDLRRRAVVDQGLLRACAYALLLRRREAASKDVPVEIGRRRYCPWIHPSRPRFAGRLRMRPS